MMIKYTNLKYIALWLTTFILQALAMDCLAQPVESFPGGLAKVPLDTGETELYFNQARVLIQRQGNQRIAVVGIPVSQKEGIVYLTSRPSGDSKQSYPIKIVPKYYPQESITIKDETRVNPPAKEISRIKEEHQRLNAALSNWNDLPVENLYLSKPVQGRVSSEFGFKRIINGRPKDPHRGIDFAANRGTPVKASAQGVVTLVGDLFYTGNTVVIDHGQGWQTIYCHLDTVAVQEGQTVTPKIILGTVGETGRATGPHLHFGVILNQARVDPSLFWNSDN